MGPPWRNLEATAGLWLLGGGVEVQPSAWSLALPPACGPSKLSGLSKHSLLV